MASSSDLKSGRTGRAKSKRPVRLVGAVLAEQNDEWAIARRYMSLGAITTVCSIDEPAKTLPAKEVQLAVTA